MLSVSGPQRLQDQTCGLVLWVQFQRHGETATLLVRPVCGAVQSHVASTNTRRLVRCSTMNAARAVGSQPTMSSVGTRREAKRPR